MKLIHGTPTTLDLITESSSLNNECQQMIQEISASFTINQIGTKIINAIKKLIMWFRSVARRVIVFVRRAIDWFLRRENPANFVYKNYKEVRVDESRIRQIQSMVQNISAPTAEDFQEISRIHADSIRVYVKDMALTFGDKHTSDTLKGVSHSLESHTLTIDIAEKIVLDLENKMPSMRGDAKELAEKLLGWLQRLVQMLSQQVTVTNGIIQENMRVQKRLIEDFRAYRTPGLAQQGLPLSEWIYREIDSGEERAATLAPIATNPSDFDKLYGSAVKGVEYVSEYLTAHIRVFFAHDIGSRYEGRLFDSLDVVGTGATNRGQLYANPGLTGNGIVTMQTMDEDSLEVLLSGSAIPFNYRLGGLNHNECILKSHRYPISVISITNNGGSSKKLFTQLQTYPKTKQQHLERFQSIANEM